MAASRALYPATPRSSWLGRAKHVTFDGPAKWQVIVGVPTSVFVDLSRARPAGENRPPSRLRVEVLDGYSAKAGSPEPLVVWSVERSVSNDSDSLEVPVGPLAVAGDLHIAVYLDGQAVRDSPQPLHVTPAPPSAAHSELIGGPTGSRVVAVAGAPAVFFVLLRDGCGNRCVGGLRAHLQQHYAAALHLMRSMAAGPPRPPQDDHAGIHGSGAVHFSRRLAGEYEAVVHMNGQRLMPPLLVEVRAAAAHAPNCHCEGASLDEAVAGREMRFNLVAFD
eukprot:jgi/Chrpa1/6721/Chrysochromulina_OHIO_Genome00009959-RA